MELYKIGAGLVVFDQSFQSVILHLKWTCARYMDVAPLRWYMHYTLIKLWLIILLIALNCDDMLSVSAASLLCSGINIPDPSAR